MKIVIAGAGGIGFHLAKLLSYAQQDIILIDSNQDVLDYAQNHIDVRTVFGDSSSIHILKEAEIHRANLFLAVTTLENNNIVSCILAKKLGAKQTIARINNIANLQKEYKSTFKDLGVDKIISPSMLAAQEIMRLIQLYQVTDSFDFEEGKITLVGLTLDDTSLYNGRSIEEVNIEKNTNYNPIAILRGTETILPRSNTILRRGDHIYFLSKKCDLENLMQTIGKPPRKIKKLMFIGGNEISLQVAKNLEDDYKITIIEQDEKICKYLTTQLNNTLIIKGDPSNIELLREEGLEEMDAFISVTPNSETNIIASLMADTSGVYKTIALVDNTDYTHISQNIGVDTLINKKLIAANYIFRFVRKGKIEAITSLHGVDAEVIEFTVLKENRATKTSLRNIKFPEKAIIGAVIRGEDSYIPNGDFVLKVNDKVIVLATSAAIGKVEEFFR
ncbi:MAG: Trk system potassium transporter TrkA [Saprospiraceae bacterium]|nr:Trk system potassium transporter TrkA [Saprospiraceae bacterium]